MKRALFVLVIVLMAATTYNQTPRRATSTNATAGRTETRSATSTRSTTANTQNNPSRPSNGNNQVTRSTSTSSGSTHSDNQNPRGNNVSGNQDRQDNHPSNTNTNRTYGNQNNPPRTTENHSENNNHGNNDRGHDGRQVEAHHYNNVNANTNVHTEYPSTRVYRGEHHPTYSHHEGYRPEAKSYREVHYIYREPVHYNVVWTREMHRTYCEIYPEVHYWRYNDGYRIGTISAYRADFYIGEVMNVYGQVTDIFYSPESDEYFLYIGPYYPYQDFTVVVPGWIARNYSFRPVNYFLNQYICITGLITAYDGTPEIDVKRNFQITVY